MEQDVKILQEKITMCQKMLTQTQNDFTVQEYMGLKKLLDQVEGELLQFDRFDSEPPLKMLHQTLVTMQQEVQNLVYESQTSKEPSQIGKLIPSAFSPFNERYFQTNQEHHHTLKHHTKLTSVQPSYQRLGLNEPITAKTLEQLVTEKQQTPKKNVKSASSIESFTKMESVYAEESVKAKPEPPVETGEELVKEKSMEGVGKLNQTEPPEISIEPTAIRTVDSVEESVKVKPEPPVETGEELVKEKSMEGVENLNQTELPEISIEPTVIKAVDSAEESVKATPEPPVETGEELVKEKSMEGVGNLNQTEPPELPLEKIEELLVEKEKNHLETEESNPNSPIELQKKIHRMVETQAKGSELDDKVVEQIAERINTKLTEQVEPFNEKLIEQIAELVNAKLVNQMELLDNKPTASEEELVNEKRTEQLEQLEEEKIIDPTPDKGENFFSFLPFFKKFKR